MSGYQITTKRLPALLITVVLIGCDQTENQQVANPPNLSGQQEPISAAELHASGRDSLVGKDSFTFTPADVTEPDAQLDSRVYDPLGQPRGSELRPIPNPQSGVVGAQQQGVGPIQAGQPGIGQPGIGQPGMAQIPLTPAEIAKQAMNGPLQLADANSGAIANKPDQPQPQFQLKSDMTPAELVAFMSNADKDMRTINSGRSAITDQREAEIQMGTISRLKLEASRALQDHPDATAKDMTEGVRGEMQALSHLAGMKNAAAANELMALATKNLRSNDAALVSDSRIVLIGFALESLQAGANDKAPDQIVSLVNQFKKDDKYTSVPALMVMAQARNILTQYGYDDQALAVREQILTLFAQSPDPTIASLAKQAAGNASYDKIDKLLTKTLDGENTPVADWRDAVSRLIDQAPDLATARYLSSAALEFESANNDELATATYDILSDRFNDPDQTATIDVQTAIKLRNARKSVVGTFMETSFKSLAGASMPISKFKGKVVLMPFWAMEQPASLQIFPLLSEIQKSHPDDVAIVGMNFDSDQAPLEEFLMKVKLDFPSYASGMANADPQKSILAHFGLASLPFVAILDQDAKVIALDFRGRNIKPIVQRLLKQ